MPNTVEGRLTKLEGVAASTQKDIGTLRDNISHLADVISTNHAEWRRAKDAETELRAEEAKARAETASASRMTLPQIITSLAAVVTMCTAGIVGAMYIVRSETDTVRADLRRAETGLVAKVEAESAKTALQVRGQQEAITAAQGGLQSLQRDLGQVSVKLGLTEAGTMRNADQLKDMAGYDAHIARNEERVRALQDEVRAMAQRLRAN